MQQSIEPNSEPTPERPLNRSRYENSDAKNQENCTVNESSFASVYGGTNAAIDYSSTNRQGKIVPIADGTATEKINPSINHDWSTSLQSLLDQPPATLPLRMLLGGMAFFTAFGVWANVGKIEEIGHARGQLVPQGEPYKINPVVPGKIARIAVKEGETVKAGQVLLELDNQIATNEIERLEKERSSYQTQYSQTQVLIDQTRLEAQTHAAIALAKENAQQAIVQQANARVQGVQKTIAQAQEKVTTTKELLAQMQAEALAYKARRERLQPLAARSKELLARLQVDADASKRRQEQLQPLPRMSQELIEKLQVDVDAAKARIERLRPIVEEGALPRERLADLEQALRDRERAITEAKLADESRTKEQLFQAEQALRDRQRAILQTQLQDDSSIKEQLFQAEQALRDRDRAITQTEGDLKQASKELERLQAELKQAQAELNRLQAENNQNQAEAEAIQVQNRQKIQQLEVQKTQVKAQADQTEKQLKRAKTELKQLVFTAPVDGVVLSLNIDNPGEVVQPGQIVAELAPQEAPLVLMAKLPNQEAGFIKTGQEVKIKLDSYPFQEYGIVSGKVVSISPDTKPDQQLGAVYQLQIALDRHNVTAADAQKIAFKPGQTATADIIIRRRRIADILLDPIKQMQKGGLNL
ncbi:MAG TPA: secretion protein HlyD [Cyanobacteria bacterium UBA11368]|nr:secretion protein HlyD [Cyanobacteria bacterium UBA11368]